MTCNLWLRKRFLVAIDKLQVVDNIFYLLETLQSMGTNIAPALLDINFVLVY